MLGEGAAAGPPLEGPQPSMDASYEVLLTTLPPGLHDVARGLPHRLGVAKHPDGGWQELVTLHPNRALPVYAAEPAGGLAHEPGRLLGFVRAHHYAAFSWVARDRIADGQVAPEPQLLALSRALAERWLAELEQASGDGALVQQMVDAVTRRWRRGVDRERAALRAGSLDGTAYAALVRDKLGWIGVSSLCLLASTPAVRRGRQQASARAFRQAHDLFLLGLQAIDDVNDADEDRALYGHDVSSALGCSNGALLRVAPKLLRRAGVVAGEAGFSRLAFWLAAFARAINPLHREGDQLGDELDAIALAGVMEQAIEEDPDDGRDPVAAAPRVAAVADALPAEVS